MVTLVCKVCDGEIYPCGVMGSGKPVKDPQQYVGDKAPTHYHHRAASDGHTALPVREG